MKFAHFSAYSEHNVELAVLVAPDEVIMIVEGKQVVGDKLVCNLFTRRGNGCVVYGSAAEVEATLLEARRVN